LVKELTSAPQGLAVDPSNGRLYLTNSWGKVQRMNLNGSSFQPDHIVNLDSPRGIAVDAAGGKVELTSAPQGLAVDPSNGRLYLTNSWGKVQRMNLNGSGFQPNLLDSSST
jgi:DNA-binding beta-propeller fold protein YncE